MCSEREARNKAAEASMFGERGILVAVYRSIGADGSTLGYFTKFGSDKPGVECARAEPVALYRRGAEVGI